MSGGKASTLVIELQCEKCCKKIQKILCKLQEQEKIKSICYDTEKNNFTISGPFDPQKLSEKLKCKAWKACLDIKITIPKEKKPDTEGQKKPDGKKPQEPKEAATASASTTVNMRFSQVCQICYPWPCNHPNHCLALPQKWPCPGVPVPSNNQCPQNWCVPPTPCRGSSSCGGCGSCGGGGAYGCPVKPPPPVCCPGPSCRGCNACRPPVCCPGPSCRGCNACRPPVCCPGPSCRGCKGCLIVHEEKFRYEEYPSSWCAIM